MTWLLFPIALVSVDIALWFVFIYARGFERNDTINAIIAVDVCMIVVAIVKTLSN